MRKYLLENEWSVIEEGFDESLNKVSESIFSTGNGKFGNRANFEEYYSGSSLLGNYISGIYYPDKTKVGWWKNGYPEYFAKVLNAPNWLGIKTKINANKLDLAASKLMDFRRELNMKSGLLSKSYQANLSSGETVLVQSERFISMANDEIAAIKYQITSEFEGTLELLLDIDGDIVNSDSNYDEKFWVEIDKSADSRYLTVETKKTKFRVSESFAYKIYKNGTEAMELNPESLESDKYIGHQCNIFVQKGDVISIEKFVSVCSSLYYDNDLLSNTAIEKAHAASLTGYNQLKEEHLDAWSERWRDGDIIIKGDVAAQQGIRFNIFQLHQTYTGKDARLNIGPKGLTGEKYGGSTYWDTEAYCLPFYMSTAAKEVSYNLLKYRYQQLDKAIENAQKLGFHSGAALFPMVTMNGEECHNEWEITFEEIHRNGAIAYAIFNYCRYYDDQSYLTEGGLEVLIAISRFWAQRVNFSKHKNQYVMLGVTGPNEYENNVNNNWYTNRIASWCLEYTRECMQYLEESKVEKLSTIKEKVSWNDSEGEKWQDIIENMYYPVDTNARLKLQQDGFLDKDIYPAKEIPAGQRPIHEHWSWDRILRSCFIKQADVLQGLWFLEHLYDKDTIEINFDYYEPLTVHESSLSSCIHSIQASLLGKHDKAYQFYLNASRLDLDDYNNDTKDGLHITSMGGTWMTIVYGFAGMRVKENRLTFTPNLPHNWKSFNFNLLFRGQQMNVNIGKKEIILTNHGTEKVSVVILDKCYEIDLNNSKSIKYE
ncbi:MAG: family 65 glycosyl hydrolase domain-containing protein [Saprospiraceae bacterium]